MVMIEEKGRDITTEFAATPSAPQNIPRSPTPIVRMDSVSLHDNFHFAFAAVQYSSISTILSLSKSIA